MLIKIIHRNSLTIHLTSATCKWPYSALEGKSLKIDVNTKLISSSEAADLAPTQKEPCFVHDLENEYEIFVFVFVYACV